jgi:hypothetical protein
MIPRHRQAPVINASRYKNSSNYIAAISLSL